MRSILPFATTVIACFVLALGCDRTAVKDGPAETNRNPPQVENQTSQLTGGQAIQQPAVVDEAPNQPVSDTNTSTSENRFVTLPPVNSDDPASLLQYLNEIDREIQDLLLSSRQMEQQAMQAAAKQLSQMKLEAAQQLSKLPSASLEQSLAGIKAQLVALSHLSGLKDVESARKLEQLATSLLEHPDAELRHQGQIVLFGFQIQELQNGVLKDAGQLVRSASEMLADPNYRTRLEMTSVAHALNVLNQMGFSNEAEELELVCFEAFSNSYDRELRFEAWNQLTRQSLNVENFLNSLRALKDSNADGTPVLAAARGLLEEFPNPVTLEMIAGVIPDVEYGGNLFLSTELTSLVDAELKKYSQPVSLEAIEATLSEHRQRMSWIDRKFELSGLIDQDGKQLDMQLLEGKVVLIDFWATWCPPCLQEMPNLRNVFDELSGKGFSILSINMDKDEERLKQFLEDQRFPWPTYRSADGDSKSLTDKFGITLFPHTMLLNQKGIVIGLHVRGDEVRKLVGQSLQN